MSYISPIEYISPRPWMIQHSQAATDQYRRWILDAEFNRIACMYHKDFNMYSTCMPDAEHIIKCVNEHDSLVAEVERLKQENEQLREALRKCSPMTACNDRNNNVCEFCFEKEHADDCEYITLTK